MDTWTRADGAGVSSTPEDMSRFFEEPVFGTEVFDASGGGFPINQDFFDANDTMCYQPANNTPSWNEISNPGGTDTYQQYAPNFDFVNYESHGMVGAQPWERTEVPYGLEMQEYILQPTDSALALSGQGDTRYSSKSKQTLDHHAPAKESSNLQRTHQNTLFAEPSSVYDNPSLSVDELNDRPHVSTRPRPAKGTENTPTEKKIERTSKGTYRPDVSIRYVEADRSQQSRPSSRKRKSCASTADYTYSQFQAPGGQQYTTVIFGPILWLRRHRVFILIARPLALTILTLQPFTSRTETGVSMIAKTVPRHVSCGCVTETLLYRSLVT